MKKPEHVPVRISEFCVAKGPAVLKSYGLGSCVGVTLYDPKIKVGGLAHVLLPSGKKVPSSQQNPLKFADIAIEKMRDELVREGCDPKRLVAKIAGGANMFSHRYNINPDQVVKPGIGKRNVQAVKKKLKELGIKLVSEDVGGETGRTLEFDTESGKMHVASPGGKVKIF